jgi:hypothetical protein
MGQHFVMKIVKLVADLLEVLGDQDPDSRRLTRVLAKGLRHIANGLRGHN